jgi:hypothetical protein
MELPQHPLRVAMQKMHDGSERSRADDAVIDFSIGLESLLTAGIRDELNYRFALRGARIMAMHGQNKESAFRDLRKLYSARSDLVHATKVSEDLRTLRTIGANNLRAIWWWYFDRLPEPPEKDNEALDALILG